MTLSTVVFTTSIRLIKATINGAFYGAKGGFALEKQFMAWEKDMEIEEIFDGYEGWIEGDDHTGLMVQSFDVYSGAIEVEDDDIPANAIYARDCIACDGLFKTPRKGELMCDICLSGDDQVDKHSEYHMDTCCIKATGVCNCDLPF